MDRLPQKLGELVIDSARRRSSNQILQTRSGKSYSPWRVINAPEDFDYASLLRDSIANAEALEALDDIDVTPSEAPAPVVGAATTPGPSPSSAAASFAPPDTSVRNGAETGRVQSRRDLALKGKSRASKSRTKASGSPRKTKSSGRKKKETPPGVMSKANARRQNRRIAEKVEHGHRPSPAAFKKYVLGAPTVSVGLDSVNLPATAGGYGARNASNNTAPRDVSKEELVEQHSFTPVEWNGM